MFGEGMRQYIFEYANKQLWKESTKVQEVDNTAKSGPEFEELRRNFDPMKQSDKDDFGLLIGDKEKDEIFEHLLYLTSTERAAEGIKPKRPKYIVDEDLLNEQRRKDKQKETLQTEEKAEKHKNTDNTPPYIYPGKKSKNSKKSKRGKTEKKPEKPITDRKDLDKRKVNEKEVDQQQHIFPSIVITKWKYQTKNPPILQTRKMKETFHKIRKTIK
ncbi:hypothetical protein JTB14_022047 [Gonioctena quinquepunctata]|nr:hypothetical protein JTB14_022047 [Gonioctena quinquepunctata]